jgi:hypothetical protein
MNIAIRNADFLTKKKNGYSESDILITKELLPIKDWSPAAIDERQRELSRWVFEIWKFPGEAPLTSTAKSTAGGDDIETRKSAEDETSLLDQLPEVPASAE